MKKSAKRKQKQKAAQREACSDTTPVCPEQAALYAPKPLLDDIDYELERKAVQDILDAALRLQTFIAMRERRR